MGINCNTPDYIWKLEAGIRSIALYTRERAIAYIASILDMEENRWPKICLREEIRALKNGEPSRWGTDLKSVWEEAVKGEVQQLLNGGVKGEVFRGKMREALDILKEQDIQRDFSRVDKSRYWEGYKDYKCSYERNNIGKKKT